MRKKSLKLKVFHNPFAQRLWSCSESHVGKVSAITVLNNIRQDDADCADLAEPLLRVTLFGQMRAEDVSRQSVLPRSRKTRAVLAVLALAAPRPVLRTRLAALLWSQRAREQARASLRQSLHELQRALGPHAQSLLQSDRHNILLNDIRLWVDVRALAAATAANPDALGLFQPTFLDDLNGLDPAFDLWIAEERHRATLQARSLAEGLLSAESDARERMVAAERLLSIERAHEGGWQALIRSYLQQGDRAAAQLAFERYITTVSLAGMSPSAELEGLIRGTPQIRPSPHVRAVKAGWGTGVRVVVLPPRALDCDGVDGLLTGLAGELTAAVSCFRWLSCVAGASRVHQPPLMGDESGGDYLLDSTVQRSGTSVRIIVHLLDRAAGNQVVWAKRFDRELRDLLTLQSAIAAETAAQIDPELLLREGARRIGMAGQSGFDLTLQAIPAIYRLEPAGFRAAGELLAAAVDLDPSNAAAHAWWAYWHLLLVGQGWADDSVTATSRAGDLAARAVTLDPGDARAVTLVGHVRGFLHKRPQEARVLHERALSLNPNLPLAWCFSGLASSYLGEHEEAIQRIIRAQTLSPHDPHAFFFDMALMMPYFLQGELKRALALGRRAIELNPGCSSTYKGYLATLGQLNCKPEADLVLAKLREMEPGFCVRSAVERSPMMRRADVDFYAEGLRKAGLSEG